MDFNKIKNPETLYVSNDVYSIFLGIITSEILTKLALDEFVMQIMHSKWHL